MPVAEPAPPSLSEAARPVEAARIAEALPTPAAERTHVGEPASLAKPEVVAPAALAVAIELRPSAVNAKIAWRVHLEIEKSGGATPEVPRAEIAPPVVLLDLAPRLSYLAAVDPVSAPWQARAGRLEIRDFARTEPTLDLGASLVAPRMERATHPVKMAVAPAPSRSDPALWTEPPQDFRDGPVQIGEIAALDLPTTGFETTGVSGPAAAVESPADIGTPREVESAPPATTSEPETLSPSEAMAPPVTAPAAPGEVFEPEIPFVPENAAEPVAGDEADGAAATPAQLAPAAMSTANPIASPVDLPVPAAASEPRPWPETKPSLETQASTEGGGSNETEPSPEDELPPAAELLREAEPSFETGPTTETPVAHEPLAGREPARFTQPMHVVLAGIPPGKAKALQIFTSTLKASAAGQIPRYETLPLRATMVLGRAETSAPKAEPAQLDKARGPVKEPAAKTPVKWPAPRLHADPAGAKAAGAPAPPAMKPAGKVASPLKVEPLANAPAARIASPSRVIPQPAVKLPEGSTPRDPVRVQPGSEREVAEVNREQAKLNREQAELNRAQAELNREQARRNRELSKSAEKVAASTAPLAEPKGPSAIPGLKGTKPASLTSLSLSEAPPAQGETDLGLPIFDLEAAKGRFPPWAKIAAAAACVLLLVSGIWFLTNHNRAKGPETLVVSSLTAGAGPEWIENFSPDFKHPRTISVLRASEKWNDYSIEFSASVDVKALGWVFRAKDPANFYVGRIEQEKTLAGTAATFVYFPVVGGVPQPRKRSSVALPAAPGTIYKIRFDVSGDQFTAWIQDRKVEEWTDNSLRSGGAGLYSESGERALLQGAFRVVPRIPAR